MERPGTRLCLALLFGLVSPATAQSGTRPQLSVDYGLQGYVRAGRLAPVRITVATSGEPVRGRLELAGDADDGMEIRVDVPRYGRQRFVAYVTPRRPRDGKSRVSLEVRLRSGRRVVAFQRVAAQALPRGAPLVVSITGDGTGLQFLEGAPWGGLPDASGAARLRTVQLQPDDLPAHPAALYAADAVVVTGRAWSTLEPGLRSALRQWVETGGWPDADETASGGRAILCGGAPGDWSDPDAACLTAIEPAHTVSVKRLSGRGPWLGVEFSPPGGGQILALAGAPLGAGGPALLGSANAPLARRRDTAGGAALWYGFDPLGPSFRDWDDKRGFWLRALGEAMAEAPSSGTATPAARKAATWVPRLPAPPVGTILAFALVYVVLFGPVNLWLVRRLRGTGRGWLTMPALALGMTGALLAAGQSWGSGRAVLNVVTLLETRSGARSARQQTWAGLFSPTNRSFDLRSHDPAPVLAQVSDDSRSMPVLWPTRVLEGETHFEGQVTALYAITEWRLARAAELEGRITATRLSDGGLEVANETSHTLQSVALISGPRQVGLGQLMPGERRRWRRSDLPLTEPRRDVEAAGFEATAAAARASLVESLAALARAPQPTSHSWLIAEIAGLDAGLSWDGLRITNQFTLVFLPVLEGRP